MFIKPCIILLILLQFGANLADESGEDRRGGPIGEKLLEDAKVFDDPYLAAEKDADVYDTAENRLSEILVPKKRNFYKEQKKSESPRQEQPMGLKGAAELAEEAAQEHRKMFEELATFNYGIIGIMKKQRLEDSADEQQKRRGEMGQPLSQSQKSISSEELNGENSDETGESHEGKAPKWTTRTTMRTSAIGSDGGKGVSANTKLDDWKAMEDFGTGRLSPVDTVYGEGPAESGKDSNYQHGAEAADLDTVGWFE